MSDHFHISEIVLRLCRVDMTRVNRYSSGATDPEWRSIVVEVRLGEASGWGEFIPTSLIYEEGHIGRSGLNEWELAQKVADRLVGTDARHTRLWLDEELDQEGANSLVDGFDFALHDAVARSLGWSVQQLLGGGSPWVLGMPVIHTDSPEAMAEHCLKLHRDGGYTWFKLKPVCDLEQDRETMCRIRELIGKDTQFCIDPNYCLEGDADSVVTYLNGLHEAGLKICEDPIKPDAGAYREIQRRTPVDLMLDEKVRTLDGVRQFGEARCIRGINIHANWASGFLRGLQRAELARSFGLESMIGSVRYLGFGTAAYQTLASLLPGQPAICEQVNDADYVKKLAIRTPYETRDGKIFIFPSPGLGVEPHWENLESLTLDELVFA
jgi:L-alanine-DL-glutamate epimerase-like enolase superfamily enzyme